MSINIYIERIQRIDKLIRMNATGTPQELAGKIGISRRMLYEYLEIMNDFGAPLYYNKSLKSYVYEENVKFIIGFKII